MALDGNNWPLLNIRCVVPSCECKSFKPGAVLVRQCDCCAHSWVAHVLAKLNPLPLFPSPLMEGIAGAIAYDVASMILFGSQAIPVRLKILLDRLVPAHLQTDINRILHLFGWTFQDYSRGYMLLDNMGQARERWSTCGREEEPVILQQFLRFFETRALAYEMLLSDSIGAPGFQLSPASRLNSNDLLNVPLPESGLNAASRSLPVSHDHPLKPSAVTRDANSCVLINRSATSAINAARTNNSTRLPATLNGKNALSAAVGGMFNMRPFPGLDNLPTPPPFALSHLFPLVSPPVSQTGLFGGTASTSSATSNSPSTTSTVSHSSPTSLAFSNMTSSAGFPVPPFAGGEKKPLNAEIATCKEETKLRKSFNNPSIPTPPSCKRSKMSCSFKDSHKSYSANGSNCRSKQQYSSRSFNVTMSPSFSSNQATSELNSSSEQHYKALDNTEEEDEQGIEIAEGEELIKRDDLGSGSPFSSESNSEAGALRGLSSADLALCGTTSASSGRAKKRVLCTTCGKTFCDKGALKIHYSAVHLQEMHKCTMQGCNMWFSSRRSRNRHSANPNPRLHMSQTNKKLPDNAIIVDDGSGRTLGDRIPIPQSVLNPPVVSPDSNLTSSSDSTAFNSSKPQASSSPFSSPPTSLSTISASNFTKKIGQNVFPSLRHHRKPPHDDHFTSKCSIQHESPFDRLSSLDNSEGNSLLSSPTPCNQADYELGEPMNLVLSKSSYEEIDDPTASDIDNESTCVPSNMVQPISVNVETQAGAASNKTVDDDDKKDILSKAIEENNNSTKISSSSSYVGEEEEDKVVSSPSPPLLHSQLDEGDEFDQSTNLSLGSHSVEIDTATKRSKLDDNLFHAKSGRRLLSS